MTFPAFFTFSMHSHELYSSFFSQLILEFSTFISRPVTVISLHLNVRFVTRESSFLPPRNYSTPSYLKHIFVHGTVFATINHLFTHFYRSFLIMGIIRLKIRLWRHRHQNHSGQVNWLQTHILCKMAPLVSSWSVPVSNVRHLCSSLSHLYFSTDKTVSKCVKR